MKTYFAKYLSVEGEIKKGTVYVWKDNSAGSIVDDNNDEDDLNILKEHLRKGDIYIVQLFLCSRDIQVGDRVFADDLYGIIKNFEDNHNITIEYEKSREVNGGIGIYCVDKDCPDYDGDDSIIKVIGRISSGATWVKEGDEFEKDQLRMIVKGNQNSWDFDPTFKDHPFTILIKCPCCGTFK